MKVKSKFLLLCLCCLCALLVAIGVGSAGINPAEIIAILGHKLFRLPLSEGINKNLVSILWSIRLPRVLCAFAVGASLSVSGAVLQSVLGNPLASSYTLGVSSGASLGAALVMMIGLYPLGMLTLPASGFVFGLGTVLLAVWFATRMDKVLKNNTIILVGMVFSLFVNAMLALINALSRETMQRLLTWQMGSFASRGFSHAGILWVSALFGIACLMRYTKEMDILTFGEEQSRAVGVNSKSIRLILIVFSSFLTGVAVCFTGTIGFVDLIAPHVVRRIFGPAHKYLLPASALFGGAFMMLADTAARTVIAPLELPVGAVTALIGAPFFAWVYFKSAKSGKGKRGRRHASV